MSTVAVLGAGAWGTALALLLADNQKTTVRLWGHHEAHMQALQRDHENKRYLPSFAFPDNLSCSSSLEETLSGIDAVLVVVPSHAFRGVVESMKPHLADSMHVAWACKGLDPKTHDFLSEVFTEIMGERAFAILSGPSFAKEVAAQKPTAITLATEDEAACEFWQSHCHSSYFRVYHSQDVIGVQLGGAVKNVLAIATGIADGLDLGANTQAALITRGLREMMRLGKAMGGQVETFMGLAGMGDLILTCTDNQSRNRRFGLLLGEGKTAEQALSAIDQVVEGQQTTQLIHALAKQHQVDMPITEQVYQVLYENKTPQAAATTLLARPLKTEF